jgi:putative sterol carrier protein
VAALVQMIPGITDVGGRRHHQADYEPMLRYLSLDWINALSEEVDRNEHLREIAASHRIGVTQVVSDGPEGDVTYHLTVGDGEAAFGAGPADPEDVKMEQDWETAVAVATGALNAQEAFIGGRIRLFGDQQKLLDAQPVFGALDAVFSSVRERTTYE